MYCTLCLFTDILLLCAKNGAWGPLFIFPTVIFILPILKKKEKKKNPPTESHIHSFYFYSLTVIKDNSSSKLSDWKQSHAVFGRAQFLNTVPKLPINYEGGLRNFS